jgi:hypothetical protein
MSISTPPSKGALWTGYIMGIVPTLLMLLSAFMKFAPPPDAVKGFEHLGVPM